MQTHFTLLGAALIAAPLLLQDGPSTDPLPSPSPFALNSTRQQSEGTLDQLRAELQELRRLQAENRELTRQLERRLGAGGERSLGSLFQAAQEQPEHDDFFMGRDAARSARAERLDALETALVERRDRRTALEQRIAEGAQDPAAEAADQLQLAQLRAEQAQLEQELEAVHSAFAQDDRASGAEDFFFSRADAQQADSQALALARELAEAQRSAQHQQMQGLRRELSELREHQSLLEEARESSGGDPGIDEVLRALDSERSELEQQLAEAADLAAAAAATARESASAAAQAARQALMEQRESLTAARARADTDGWLRIAREHAAGASDSLPRRQGQQGGQWAPLLRDRQRASGTTITTTTTSTTDGAGPDSADHARMLDLLLEIRAELGEMRSEVRALGAQLEGADAPAPNSTVEVGGGPPSDTTTAPYASPTSSSSLLTAADSLVR